ncbi:hypothetical protein BJF96_g4158 [Verticillium dahliae]|uniref:Uncharacterized protein n=1 Tax=Verticillium dahliae TaxID=27337 RepID=A0AA44WMP0_VERDA|nr:hypothetical protein BJF96_g4158 [Verticillium dahliae]
MILLLQVDVPATLTCKRRTPVVSKNQSPWLEVSYGGGVSRCSECVRRGRSCDGSGVPVNALSRITQELGKLDKKELDEEARLEELQSQVAEALSRLKRLRTQKRSLHERGVKMVNQGLQSLDELDSAEREESEAVVAVQAAGGFGVIDWSALGSFDPESLDFLGTGDTASATVGSSGS